MQDNDFFLNIDPLKIKQERQSEGNFEQFQPKSVNSDKQSIQECKEEMNHFMEVVASILNYKNDSQLEIMRMQYGYSQLSNEQKSLLKHSFQSKISDFQEAVNNNYILLC